MANCAGVVHRLECLLAKENVVGSIPIARSDLFVTSMYKIHGKVRHGQNRGKSLGFPTVNINVSSRIPEGIYVSQTKFNQKKYPSLTFIGAAITFEETNIQSETYIFGLNQNLYGKVISVEIIKKLRENKKFDSSESLIKQMEEDRRQALEYFKKHV